MDLESLVESLEGPMARQAVSRWFAELESEPTGQTVAGHIRGEENLALHDEGREAIRRLSRAIGARGSDDPVQRYKDALKDRTLDLGVHGPEADGALPDQLCKLASAWSVWRHLGGADKPRIPYASFRSPAYQGTIERWLMTSVCSPGHREALSPGHEVSGELPTVFSTLEEERDAKFPHGTPANRCREILGLEPLDPPEAHALLRYSNRDVGPARVPTAFDAGIHPHFVPPPAGARWGTTKNLASPGSEGVREVVVKPFPVALLRQPVFIDKTPK
jgi:hypothetical protein